MRVTLFLLLGLWLSWLGIGITAERQARRRLDAVPIRILVSGGRGKTTLVRLVHAGLRAAGQTAVARISGDAPTVINSDGSEHPERRWGPANIRELRRLGRYVARCSKGAAVEGTVVEAMVVESMAIDPELQAVVAHRLVRPTLALLAPDALDHLEVLPTDQQERVRLQLAALPAGTELLLPGDDAGRAFGPPASQLGLDWTAAPPCPAAGLRPFMAVLAGMALQAVASCGNGTGAGTRETAARDAVLAAAQRLQTITVYRRDRVAWVDGMSANDPVAALQLAEIAAQEARHRGYATTARLFNHRADRPSRLPLFAPLLDSELAWVVGAPVPPALAGGVPAPRLHGEAATIVAAIEGHLAERSGPAWVLCLGNTAGIGRSLRRWLAGHAEVETW